MDDSEKRGPDSLEESLGEVPKKGVLSRVKNYGKFTLESIVFNTLCAFGVRPNMFISEEKEEKNPTFAQEVINSSVLWAVYPVIVGTAFSCPKFGIAFVGSNALIGGYRMISHFRKPKEEKPEKEPFLVGLKNFVRKVPRKLLRYACTYTVVAALAFGHYKAFKGIDREYDPSMQDLTVQKFVLEREEGDYTFYLLGEAHIYNYSSSYYAKHLLQELRPDLLLSEGIGREEGEKLAGWKGAVEYGLIVPYTILTKGSQRIFASVSAYCEKGGVPVVYLEKVEDSGRAGTSNSAYVVLAGMDIIGILKGPSLYFGAVPLRYFGFPKYFINAGIPDIGLLNKRNELMVENSLSEMVPGFIHLIRVGAAHSPGIIEEFQKYGQLREVPFEFKPEPNQ